MGWWPWKRRGARREPAYTSEADMQRKFTLGALHASRNFAVVLLHVMVKREMVSAGQAGVILRDVADMLRDDRAIGPVCDILAGTFDDAAIIFEPREPGPPPPGRAAPPPPIV